MTPREITDKMLEKDAFSKWLGVEVLDVGLGTSHIRFVVREDMCNGFGTAHGGIAHSVSDSAFAFACNSYGTKAVAAETAISYFKALYPGDVVDVIAEQEHRTRKLGRYRITLFREKEKVALFYATCYHLDLTWEK
jgi:acyl-CoA thioesterase